MHEKKVYPSSQDTQRRQYSLRRGLIYLSEWSSGQGVPIQYSIDVEKANDSHYEISAEEMEKLAGTLGCQNQAADLVKALSAYFRKHGEHDFVALLEEQKIRYKAYHFDDYWDEPI